MLIHRFISNTVAVPNLTPEDLCFLLWNATAATIAERFCAGEVQSSIRLGASRKIGRGVLLEGGDD